MKKFLNFLIIFSVIMGLLTFSFAAHIPSIGSGSELGELQTPIAKILGYVQWIGFAISIGMLIYVGIKYVTSAAEARANMKSALVKYIIGAIIIGAAPKLAEIIYDMGATIQK